MTHHVAQAVNRVQQLEWLRDKLSVSVFWGGSYGNSGGASVDFTSNFLTKGSTWISLSYAVTDLKLFPNDNPEF